MSNSPVRIASIGELLVEFVCVETATKHKVAAMYEGPFPSGAPGIFISQAALMGADCCFIGAVGEDAFGSVVHDRLVADGVDCQFVVTRPGLPTGTAFICYNDDGSRQFVFNIASSAASHLGDIEHLIDGMNAFRPDAFHVSGASLAIPSMAQAILVLCRALAVSGTRISFDPNVRSEFLGEAEYRSIINEITKLATYFLPSDDDLAILFPGQSFDTVASEFFATGGKCLVLKSGADGCRAATADGSSASLPGFKVEALDPTGAGDCFCAAFLTAIERDNRNLVRTLLVANAAGAMSVKHRGPMSGNSTRGQIDAFLESVQIVT